VCAVCTRVLLLSIAYVRFTRPNKFFFLSSYSIHFYSPWREEKSNGWMKRSIWISVRWLPLRLQNDLFIRSKRPMHPSEKYILLYMTYPSYVIRVYHAKMRINREQADFCLHAVILLKLCKIHKRSVFSSVAWDTGIKVLFWVLLAKTRSRPFTILSI